jgi:hypothetical protein
MGLSLLTFLIALVVQCIAAFLDLGAADCGKAAGFLVADGFIFSLNA